MQILFQLKKYQSKYQQDSSRGEQQQQQYNRFNPNSGGTHSIDFYGFSCGLNIYPNLDGIDPEHLCHISTEQECTSEHSHSRQSSCPSSATISYNGGGQSKRLLTPHSETSPAPTSSENVIV
jgi:hypothetical protein